VDAESVKPTNSKVEPSRARDGEAVSRTASLRAAAARAGTLKGNPKRRGRSRQPWTGTVVRMVSAAQGDLASGLTLAAVDSKIPDGRFAGSVPAIRTCWRCSSHFQWPLL